MPTDLNYLKSQVKTNLSYSNFIDVTNDTTEKRGKKEIRSPQGMDDVENASCCVWEEKRNQNWTNIS